jgi:ABC-type multidrug transport system ATPase subunit
MASFYQTSNNIFDLFDKVVLLCNGREIYYGPASQARSFSEEMGFVCTPGSNVADFLTSVSVLTERVVKEEKIHLVPNEPKGFEDRYKTSPLYHTMVDDMDSTRWEDLEAETQYLLETLERERSAPIPGARFLKSNYTVSLYRQTVACTKRYGSKIHTAGVLLLIC